MAHDPGSATVESLILERDSYLRLLELGTQKELEPFLEEALALVVEIAGARRGYMELEEPSDPGEQSGSIEQRHLVPGEPESGAPTRRGASCVYKLRSTFGIERGDR
jgi:hypothetical protein